MSADRFAGPIRDLAAALGKLADAIEYETAPMAAVSKPTKPSRRSRAPRRAYQPKTPASEVDVARARVTARKAGILAP